MPTSGVAVTQLNLTPEDGIIRQNICISSSAVVYFSDSLPLKSPILIITYHLELTTRFLILKIPLH